MNDQPSEFEDIEQALRQMPLRAPSPELDRRIEQALSRRPGVRWVIGLASTALAAAAALFVVVRATTDIPSTPVPSNPTGVAAAKPAVAQFLQTDEQWSEDGIVSVESDGPVRQYRLTKTHQITEMENGKLATMTFPQEEVYQCVSQAF